MKPRRCRKCGKTAVIPQKAFGPFPWKDFPSVHLIAPIELLKCSRCGELGYRPGDTETIDRSVEATVRTLVGKFIETILAREECSQIVLSQRVGVTPEYLSGLKNGTRTPGFQSFNMLKILAEEPPAFAVSDPAFRMEEIAAEQPIEAYNAVLRKLA